MKYSLDKIYLCWQNPFLSGRTPCNLGCFLGLQLTSIIDY